MDSANREAASIDATPLAKWERPEIRRIDTVSAEGSRGLGPVDVAFAS
jgi:hypothetical protein